MRKTSSRVRGSRSCNQAAVRQGLLRSLRFESLEDRRLLAATVDDFETGDFSALPWTTSGNAAWVVEAGAGTAGSFGARSGLITHSQSTSLEVTCTTGTGEVSFARQVSSETGWDYLQFTIDGAEQTRWSGNVGYGTVSFPVTAGTHTFGWSYSKDDSVNFGLDAAFIDNITFTTDFVVDNLTDIDDGVFTAGNLSLREAIRLANADPGADTITFDPSLMASGDATILLSQFDTGLDSDEFGPSAFRISSDITIVGPSGENGLTIARDGSAANFRLFYVYGGPGMEANGKLTLQNLTLSGGVAQGFNSLGGGGSAGMGGAIFNRLGTVALVGSTITANTAQGGNGFGASLSAGAGVGSNPVNNGIAGGPNGGASFGASGGFGGGGSLGLNSQAGAGGFGGGGGVGNGPAGAGGAGGFGGGGGASAENGNFGLGGFGGGAGQANVLANGFIGGGGGAGMGGAIFNESGTVTITNSTLAGNTAVGGAGANNGQGLGGSNLHPQRQCDHHQRYPRRQHSGPGRWSDLRRRGCCVRQRLRRRNGKRRAQQHDPR